VWKLEVAMASLEEEEEELRIPGFLATADARGSSGFSSFSLSIPALELSRFSCELCLSLSRGLDWRSYSTRSFGFSGSNCWGLVHMFCFVT
jgi:hypothetical protein